MSTNPNRPAPMPGQPDEFGIIIASEIELENVEFVNIGEVKFPKGQLTGIAGMSGVGKSTLSAWLIAACTNAGAGAVYLSTEDALSITRARIEAAGGKLDNVAMIDPDFATILPADIDRLGRIIEKHSAKCPVEVVILDPMADVFSVPIANDQAIRAALRPLGQLAEEYNVAIVLIGHTLKSIKKSASPQDAFPGKGIINRCRRGYIFGVNPGDENERAMVCVKDSLLGEQGRGYLFTLDSDIVSDDLTGVVVEVGNLTLYDADAKLFWYDVLRPEAAGENSGKGKGRTAELKAVATEWLNDALSPTDDNPSGLMRSGDLLAQADADGISKSTLGRAQKELDVQKERHGGRENIVWWAWLPEAHPLRQGFVQAHPEYAAELTDEAIAATIKATTPGIVPNPGASLSDDDMNKLLGGE